MSHMATSAFKRRFKFESGSEEAGLEGKPEALILSAEKDAAVWLHDAFICRWEFVQPIFLGRLRVLCPMLACLRSVQLRPLPLPVRPGLKASGSSTGPEPIRYRGGLFIPRETGRI
jgi:hypothetical protein